MSNETNVLLQSVLDMDRQERLRTQEAEEYRGKAMAKLEQDRKVIHEKHQQVAAQRIEQYAHEQQMHEQQLLEQMKEKSETVKKELDAAYAAKQEEWVKTIFARVLER